MIRSDWCVIGIGCISGSGSVSMSECDNAIKSVCVSVSECVSGRSK